MDAGNTINGLSLAEFEAVERQVAKANRKLEFNRIAASGIEQSSTFGYVVYASNSKEREPIARFNSKIHAICLSNLIGSSYLPAPVSDYSACGIEIDKYVDEIVCGKFPFIVLMFADGAILEVEPAPPYLWEPVANQIFIDKDIAVKGEYIPTGISGTFWGYDEYDAVDLADQYRLRMIKEGKF